MADDQNQKIYRTNQPPVRRAPAATATSGSDPLAELARLIGQTDPFGEFGRDNARRAAAPQAAPSFGADDYFGAAAPPPHPSTPPVAPYGAPGATRAPHPAGGLYQDDAMALSHPSAESEEFEHEAYPASNGELAPEEEDFYDDTPPSKSAHGRHGDRRLICACGDRHRRRFRLSRAVRRIAFFCPPPVIKADTAPSKIVPATASKTPNKLITDRIADHAQDEKLVSREEQPVELKNNPAVAPMPQPQPQGSAPPAATQAALGSGVISSEPKKVHTIAIRPDQASAGEGQPAVAAPLSPQPQAAPAPARQAAPPPPRVASTAPPAVNPDPPPPRQAEERAAAPARRTASTPRNAPLSLSPDAPARAPARTASVASAPAKTASVSGSYAVQLSSQRSEADAQAAFRSLQAKYPSQLGGREVLIHKVELGAKGTYYRAMVGPFASANEASTLCSGLKAAGGQCIVQRN